MDNAISVNVKSNLNLRNSSHSRRNPNQVKSTQLHIIIGHLPLSL